MILLLFFGILLGLGFGFVLGGKLTLAQVKLEVEKLASEAGAEEQAIVAKIKSVISKL